jgi:hypothetical protein
MQGAAFRSGKPYTDKGSAVLVVSCSSNSFFPYLREFLEKELALVEGTYDLLLVPGGPQFLLLTDYLPKFAWVGRKWITFLVERHGLKRVVVVSHDDCAWYQEERLIPAFVLKFGHDSMSHAERQKRDLVEVVSSLRELLPATSVEAWYAEKGADGFLTFSRR